MRALVRAATLATALSLPSALRAQDPTCEGDAPEVRALEFEGNASFPDRELALRVSTTPSSVWRRLLRVVGERRCLDRQELALDIARLQVFYRRRGFFEAKVDTAVARAGAAVRVRFRITEGAPVIVERVTVQGVDSLTGETQRAVFGALRIREGARFDQDRIRESTDSIRARLRDRGYPRADVALESNVEYAARRAHVGFTVVPGQIAYVGRVDVRVEPIQGRGQQIDEAVVRRLAGLREGALYRESELSAAHRNLYGTSAYRHVDVRTAIDSAHPLGDSLRVLIDLREDLTRQLDAEAGWGTLDCFRARTQYVDRNFLSGARRLELTGQVSKIGYGYPVDQVRGLCASELRRDPFSDTLHYFVGATLRQPAFRGTRFTPAFSLYRERRGEYLAYLRSTLVGGEASAERDVARNTPLRLAYSIEYGRTEAQPALLCFLFSRCERTEQEQLAGRYRPLAVASAAVGRVRVDNLVWPTRGDRFRVELRTSTNWLGSDRSQEFTKGWFDGTWYRPLRGGALAARLRLGAVVGNDLDLGGSPTAFIPPQERLYAGGATSVRGFQQNELGAVVYIAEDPPLEAVDPVTGDTTLSLAAGERVRRVVPTGGNSLVVGTLEWRMRPFYDALLQPTVFADVGEVWNRGQAGLGFNSLKWTPGVGIRVRTFVGPVQMNVAYNPYSRPEGPIFYDAPLREVDGRSVAPLFCVTPGNELRVEERDSQGRPLAQEDAPCPGGFRPAQSRSFLQRLTFTFSIGPDF